MTRPVDGRGVLLALDNGIAGLIAVACRQLPAPVDDRQEIGQATLILRLQSAREVVAELLHAPALSSPLAEQVAANARRRAVDPAELAADWAGLR